jgi:hypothetical protein
VDAPLPAGNRAAERFGIDDRRSGYRWAALLAALGLINLVIALNFDFATRAWFISLGSVGSKFALFALQYVIFYAILCQLPRPGCGERSEAAQSAASG